MFARYKTQPPASSGLLDTEAAARWASALGIGKVTQATVRSWAQRGHITRHRFGGRTYYASEELQTYAARRGCGTIT